MIQRYSDFCRRDAVWTVGRPPGRCALTCPMQLRLPKVLQAWLKSSSSSQRVPSMQSRLSRLRLLESSLSAGRQLRREKIRDSEDKKCEEDQRGCKECRDGGRVDVNRRWSEAERNRRDMIWPLSSSFPLYETVEVHFIMSMQSRRCRVTLPGAKTKEKLQFESAAAQSFNFHIFFVGTQRWWCGS